MFYNPINFMKGKIRIGGGVTTSLAMDTHGKALSYALLEMDITTSNRN
jgi:hypothetical protein